MIAEWRAWTRSRRVVIHPFRANAIAATRRRRARPEKTMTRRRTGIGDRLQRELHWEVIAVLGSGCGAGSCGHSHATEDDAIACDWAPAGWDDMLMCDLLVRQVRTVQPGQHRKRQRDIVDVRKI